MKKRIFIILMLLIILNIKFYYKFNEYDTISGATASNSNTDKSKSSKLEHKSYALKIILNNEEEEKNENLKIQIDNSFKVIKSLKNKIKDNKYEIDILDVYLLLEDHNSLLGKFTEKELKNIGDNIKKINQIIPDINIFLERYDSGEVNNQSFITVKKNIEIISTQYRIIQWKLYK